MDFQSMLSQLQQDATSAAAAAAESKNDSSTRSSSSTTQKSSSLLSDKKRNYTEETDNNNSTPHKRHNTTHRTSYRNTLPNDHIELNNMKISFLCIGAQKAGTSWLHEMLHHHPNLVLPPQKEIHFWDWNRPKGLGWYARQFPSSSRRRIKSGRCLYGEITPCYVVLHPKHIREIKCLFPNVKLIFMARDLLDRAWSALVMELRNAANGIEAGRFDSNDNDDDDDDNEDADPKNYDDDYFMERLRHSTHATRCDYATSLRHWLQCGFSPDQILILDFEDIATQPKQVLERVCCHIGIESDCLVRSLMKQEVLTKRVNAAKRHCSIRLSLEKKMKEFLRPMAKEFNGLLKELGYTWTLKEY